MNPLSMMKQALSIAPRTSFDGYGKEQFSAPISYAARVQLVTRSRLMPNGQVVVIDMIAYVAADTPVETNYKATYESETYKVVSVRKQIDGDGNINHIRIECSKWQE